MKFRIGHYVYGFSAITFGIITLVWHQIYSLGNISHPEFLIYFAGIVELIGGLAILWQKTIKYGAITIGTIFLVFTLYLLPPIFKMPLVYFPWGNFFEEFSIVLGGVLVFSSTFKSDSERAAKIARFAYMLYGICVLSYSLYQLFYLSYTASLVPMWIPPGQMFWAVTTTIAFALAAFAILYGYSALLAARLLTTMFIGFCFLVWLPRCISNLSELTNWFSNAKTLIVAGTAWVVADFLYQSKTIRVYSSSGYLPLERKEE